MLRFSANLGFLWPDRPLLERVDAAARAGFRAIELHWPYDIAASALRRACIDCGVEVVALNTPPGDLAKGDFGLGALPGRAAEFRDGFRLAADYAHECEAANIHVMAGVPGDSHWARAERVFAENLGFAAAAAPDLTLLLEPINPRDRPGYFYSTVEKAVQMIETVGAPNLALMFDVYHVAVGEGDVLSKLRRHYAQIRHVQIAAVPSRAEPDEGEIAYPAIFSVLEQLDYRGWVGCEYKPRADTDEGLKWAEAMSVSF